MRLDEVGARDTKICKGLKSNQARVYEYRVQSLIKYVVEVMSTGCETKEGLG